MGIRVVCVAGSIGSLVITVALAPGCAASTGDSGFGSSGGSSNSGSSGSNSGSGSSSGSGSGGASGSGGGGGNFGDGGFSGEGGCPAPNPGNFDFPGDGCDDDGDGQDNNMPVVCDQNVTLTGTAHDMANAMGICQDAMGQSWGIVSAVFTQGYGSGGAINDGQHGIMPHFGTTIMAREGSNLGILSAGFAREWDDSTGASGACPYPPTGPYGAPCFKGPQVAMTNGGTAPPGYPKAAAGCTQATDVYDAISLTLQIKVPLNAQGFQFDFDFYSGEWPEYVCTAFNDSFVAWLTSAAFMGKNGDFNISYDAKGNPVSVNNGFFETCTMNTPTGCCTTMDMMGNCTSAPTGTAMCVNGPAGLAGTGFEDDGTYCQNPSTGGGSTGWLTTTAPAKPGEVITIQFIIWDTGDVNWDSSVLVDNFKWIKAPTTTGTQPAQ
jgi:hypothetical protein